MSSDPRPALQTELTAEGEQTLVPGVRPVTLKDRLAVLAAAPMAPKRNRHASQKPCDIGLFDEAARNQLDLLDFIRAASGGASSTPKPKE